jgi:hypothetical protein
MGSFLKWKQEGLLPRPIVASLGRGRGSTSGWPAQSYRQLLAILTYRQSNLKRWRDLRIALWLDKFDIDLRLVRADLADLYTAIVVCLNRDLRTEQWAVSEDTAPSRTATRAIARRLTDPKATEEALGRLELDPLGEPFVRIGLSAFMSAEGQRVAVAMIHQLFAKGPGDIPASLGEFRQTLPAPFAKFLEGAERDWSAHAGIFAHPDGFENPLLMGAQQASDQTLINLRDLVNSSNSYWRSGCELAITALKVRPSLFGAFRLLAPVFVRIASRMAERPPFRSPTARVGLLAVALSSESVRSNEGKRLALGLKALAALSDWLTRHPDLILEIENITNEKWNQLMQTADFPEPAKELLRATDSI